jgi:uncharacterized membrane protein YgdD (TMEM256/DUF423 family)
MSSPGRTFLVLAALSGAIAVIAAAYAAHGPVVSGPREWIATGAHFELTHALAVFACVFVATAGARRALWAAVLFLAGTLLFSGSLYALASAGRSLWAWRRPRADCCSSPAGSCSPGLA